MLDKHKISAEQQMLEKIVFSDMYSALLENDIVMVSGSKEQDPLMDALSRIERLEASSYTMHKKNECCPKIELLVTEIELLKEQAKSHEHYVQSLENAMKATVDILIGETRKLWEQNGAQMVKVNSNHQRLNDMDIYIKSGLQNTVKQIEATNLFVEQVNTKVISDAEHIDEIYEILKTEELRKNLKINVRMQLLKDLHEQLKLNKQNIKSMYDVLENEEAAKENFKFVPPSEMTEERNSYTELNNKYLTEIRRLLADEKELNYNGKVNIFNEVNTNYEEHTVKDQQNNTVKEQDITVKEKKNIVKEQQDDMVKEQQNYIVKEQDSMLNEKENNTVKEQQDDTLKENTVKEQLNSTVKEQQNTVVKQQQGNTDKEQQANTVTEKKNNTVNDLQDNMVTELQNILVDEQQDNTIKEQQVNELKKQQDDTLKEKINFELSKMTTDVEAPNKTMKLNDVGKVNNNSEHALINCDMSFENILLQDTDKMNEYRNRNGLLQSLKNIKMKNTEKNNEMANIEREIEKLQSRIMLTNFFTGKLNSFYTERMEVHCQKTNQEVRHLVSDVQEGLERKIETNTDEVKKINNHCEQLETSIKKLFEVSDNLSDQIKNINENIVQLSKDMKTQENALKQDLEVISKKQENPYESYMMSAPVIPDLKAVLSKAIKTGYWAQCKKFLLQYLHKESDLYKQLVNVREDWFLHSAAEHGLIELFAILYKNSDNMNSVIEIYFVCHTAIRCGHKKLLEFFLSQGVNI